MEYTKVDHIIKSGIDIGPIDVEQLLEKIIDDYGDEIKRLVFSYVKNRADADDVTQEVFVTVYRKLNTFQGNSTLRSWIYSIAINKSKDHLRSWNKRNSRLKERLIQFTTFSSEKSNPPEEYALKKTASNHLLYQVLTLPIKYREVIILYYFKEFTINEISDALMTKEATVRTRLNRGREKLKLKITSTERGGNHG